MSLDSDLSTHVTGQAGLTALIGTRFYPEGDAPEDPLAPYVSADRVAGEKDHTFGAGNPIGETDAEYEFWIVAATKANGRAVRDALRAALQTFTGGATTTVNGVTLRDGNEQYDWETKHHYIPLEATFTAVGDV